ncbi:hypothetical protein O6H91_17G010500 [Diphasiastrum complanatum]|uniref:Uncharacterized protein n=1 Tax=Diphasiastrum complanatum TaxID=34168 RepID=A0ACC2B486_DIPCM|nr:hypothetical protein O6H91_17G010500 [Diphasiastrum complanatum]
MGKRAKWFSAVKKAFHSPTKTSEKSPVKSSDKVETTEKEPEKNTKEKRRWSFGKSSNQNLLGKSTKGSKLVAQPEQPWTETEVQSNQTAIVPLATVTAADAPAIATQSGAEVVQPAEAKKVSSYGNKDREEWAAIRIQTAIRGYLARRALRALKGLVRLQALVHGHAVRRQATTTFRYMQSLVKVQACVRARRVRMSEEGQAIQRQLWERRQQEIHARKSMQSDANALEGWNESTQSAEEIQAKIQSRQEAAVKRERALAYAFSHQLWRSSPNEASMFLDCESDKPYWGWSWLERWMTGRPWETKFYDKEVRESSVKSIEATATKVLDVDSARLNKGTKSRIGSLQAGANKLLNSYSSPLLKKVNNLGSQSPVAPPSKPAPIQISSVNPRNIPTGEEDGNGEARSTPSIRAAAIRFGSRSSYASSIWDEESLASIPSCPNYMSATQSAQAKSRSHSALKQRSGKPENELLASAKKRWSYPITVSPPSNGSHVQPVNTLTYLQGQKSPSLKSVPAVVKTERSTASLEGTGQNNI